MASETTRENTNLEEDASQSVKCCYRLPSQCLHWQNCPEHYEARSWALDNAEGWGKLYEADKYYFERNSKKNQAFPEIAIDKTTTENMQADNRTKEATGTTQEPKMEFCTFSIDLIFATIFFLASGGSLMYMVIKDYFPDFLIVFCLVFLGLASMFILVRILLVKFCTERPDQFSDLLQDPEPLNNV